MQEIHTVKLEGSNINSPLFLDVSSYKPGLYLITLENNGKKIYKKVEVIK